MNIISSSYGNDSIALIRYAFESKLENVTVVYCDTGWAADNWKARVLLGEELAKSYGFSVKRVIPKMQFEELMLHKKGFPSQRYQWCSALLKIIPFLEWLDGVDTTASATILIGKRREESKERANTPEFIESSEYHGGRRVWHPLYAHNTVARNILLARAGFIPLPHRSQECAPCINANRGDFLILTEKEIVRATKLEEKVGKTMFRPYRHMGAKGVPQVIMWAHSARGKFIAEEEEWIGGCSSGYCGI